MKFALEAVMPCQFAEGSKPPGERGLMIAILKDAIECVQGEPEMPGFTGRRRPQERERELRRLQAEATDWIFGTRRYAHCFRFSFEQVCAAVDLEPDVLRDQLRRHRVSGLRDMNSYTAGSRTLVGTRKDNGMSRYGRRMDEADDHDEAADLVDGVDAIAGE